MARDSGCVYGLNKGHSGHGRFYSAKLGGGRTPRPSDNRASYKPGIESLIEYSTRNPL